MEVELTRGKENHPEFGLISKFTFKNGSKICISKRGGDLRVPEHRGIQLSFAEIQLANDETIKQGYIDNE